MGSIATSILGVAKKERLMTRVDASIDDESLQQREFDGVVARFHAVRREIDLRICVQSTILLGAIAGALILAVVVVTLQSLGVLRVGLEFAVLFACADLLAALHWMHNDIRHVQLGQYLTQEIEPKLVRHGVGWERYHHGLPRPTPLGSYWFVGTKGLLAAAPLLVTGASLTNRANFQEYGMLATIFLLIVAIVVLTRLPRQPSPRPEEV
jgi:hypothetical protein